MVTPPPQLSNGLDSVISQEESVLEEAAVLSRMSQSSIVSLLSLDSLPSYHYLVLEVRRSSDVVNRGPFLRVVPLDKTYVFWYSKAAWCVCRPAPIFGVIHSLFFVDQATCPCR